jgi:predicted metal-dependent hydrolase
MAGIRDSLIDLEKHRLQLEQSVVKLRTSLQHWQAWEIEYEGMREEILGLRPGHTEAELVCVLKDIWKNNTQMRNRKTSAKMLTNSVHLQAKRLS